MGLRGGASEAVLRALSLEKAGWHGVGVGDHRTDPSRHMWVTLGTVAAATSRLKLSSSFANNLFRHPVDFARGAIAMNAVSAGRFEAGLGAGWHAEELRMAGDALPSPRERVDRFRESLEIVAALFRERSCHHRGVYYRVDIDDFQFEGEPPTLVAAVGGPRSCRLIAPLVDRVEVMFGPAVAGGSLDFSAFAQLTLDDLKSRIGIVRDVASGAMVGVGVFAAAGSGPEMEQLSALAGSGLQGDLVGEPTSVAEAVRKLEHLGVDRIGLTPMTSDTAEQLAPALLVG